MCCMDDCLVREYEYGPPTNFRTLEPQPYIFHPVPTTVANYHDLVSRAQTAINALPKTKGNCEKGCDCVKDAVQVAPYPKASVPTIHSGWLGMTKYDYTVKFTTYTGQCDDAAGAEIKPPAEDGRK